MKILVTGRPNVGKTQFVISLAQFYNLKNVIYTFKATNGIKHKRKLSLSDCSKLLINSTANHTKNIYDFTIPIKKGKGHINIALMDSCGITSEIHHDNTVRAGIAQAIGHYSDCDAMFHVVDSHNYKQMSSVDEEIYSFGSELGYYLVLANKIDLLFSEMTISKIKNDFKNTIVLPISAKEGKGLKEVAYYVNKIV
ncbi:GTPase domain-containing protein [Proteinivorax hydrogeniformans]|uniref:GTPase domain-containing protein n=1 Tax=Proteinivorax hydrogeniformans TaxID=1826727 RepID=A0AAU8HX61_9FIRM